ncbi:ATP-binding cassette domain-containing protein [Latilactobacillus sakei]|uniref:ATP-binding cassette domain-containing protein n=1 Tax=Latilactobacillus sakei TaxID=1599 RepID=UPI000DC64714|nr:ABC transporter ATP-binding protein [Latilactobacillus sakei]SPS03869.1 ABC transporter ATP-binding protein YtrB [Latilactobacillus sakei]
MTELTTEHLIKQFGNRVVLDDINLTLKPNTIYGLLGRNGAGKSTLLSIIANQITASSGTINWDKTPLTGRDHPLQAIYLMSEQNLFNKENRLKKIMKDTALLQGAFNQTLADKMLADFELNPKQKLNQLSTGYRTIFKTIVALCVPADYVFLDEPILGLDANHRVLLYRYILEAYENRPRTFVLSTHIIEEIANLIEHVLVLDQSRIIIDDDLETVLDHSYQISGPKEDVLAYCQELPILASEQIGTLYTNYLYTELPADRVIPDRVAIKHVDLQTIFIKLTEKGREQHV